MLTRERERERKRQEARLTLLEAEDPHPKHLEPEERERGPTTGAGSVQRCSSEKREGGESRGSWRE